jgi:hypothetical protein
MGPSQQPGPVRGGVLAARTGRPREPALARYGWPPMRCRTAS